MKHKTTALFLLLCFFACVDCSGGANDQVAMQETVWEFTASAPVRSALIQIDGAFYFGDTKGMFYCVDGITGELNWQYNAGSEISGKSAADQTNIYVLCRSGSVVCLNLVDGSFQWKFNADASSAENSWDFYTPSLLLDDATLFFGSGSSFYSVNAANGQQNWKAVLSSGNEVHMLPGADSSNVYFGDVKGNFYAYSRSSGTKIWSVSCSGLYGDNIQSQTVVDNGYLFFCGRDAKVHCVATADGKEKWSFRSPADSWLPALSLGDDGTLFVGASDDQCCYAFNSGDGVMKWKTKIPGRIFSTPLLNNGFVIFATESGGMLDYGSGAGSLSAVSSSTGELLWRSSLPQNSLSSPAAYGNITAIGCDNGKVYAFIIQ